MHVLKNVATFCKGTVTVGKKVNALYQEYLTKYPVTSVREFEEALLQLNKTVIKNLRDKCQKFAQKCPGSSIDTYKSFIVREEYITQNLWDKLLGNKSVKSKWFPGEGNSKLPSDWETYLPKHKISFIQNCTNFLVLDEIIKHEKDPLLVAEACSRTESVTNTKPQEGPIQKQAPSREKQGTDFGSMLPVNWAAMTKGERLDFVKKIQHKDFLKFVLNLDKSLNEYLTVRKTPVKTPQVSLYVNLFTFPSSVSEESKSLVKGLVESLNMMGRARLQYLELTDPPIIEIREVRR